MRSDLSIRQQVKAKKISVDDAIRQLGSLPGGKGSKTYRRLQELAKRPKG